MIYLDGPQDAYYIYIILCKDGSFYVGLTNDLIRRFEEHQTGEYPTCYTYKRRPLELKYYEMIPYLQDAIQRELQIKRWSRAKKQTLIDRHYHKLQLLSQCQNFTHHKYKEMHVPTSLRRDLRTDKDYSNEPAFIKAAERAEAFLKKHPLPKEFTQPKKKGK